MSTNGIRFVQNYLGIVYHQFIANFIHRTFAYMQCVDPGAPYTEGGTVIFECRRIEGEPDK